MTATDLLTTYGPTVVTIASAIAAATPTPPPDSPWSLLYRLIDLLAINIGKAKNRGDGR
ncbi:MAG: hypothetical protein HQL98_15535 [Magnetococcales bacterium]|nr:hypothetical protein [Magnetococcales bacterium]